MSELEGKHAVVTGAGQGIGAAIARALSEEGASVTLLGRRRALLEAVAAQLHDADCTVLDVTDSAAVDAAMGDIAQRRGRLDILVNNAGAAATAPLQRTTDEIWRQLMAVNLDGLFHCSRAVLPIMRDAGVGRIVNIASTAGLRGYAYVAAYCASKHGVIGLTRAMALELASTGITVNAICPGYTNTEIVAEAVRNIVDKTERSEDEALAELVKENPQGRLIEPEEVAVTALWLCSAAAASVNGQSIAVDGGETM